MLSIQELMLLALYDAGTRQGTIDALVKMTAVLRSDERELRSLAEQIIGKLETMSDAAYDALNFYQYVGLPDDGLLRII